MARFSLRQLLLGMTLVALFLSAIFSLFGWTRNKSGERDSQVTDIAFSPDGQKLAVVLVTVSDAGVPLKSYVTNVSRTVVLFDSAALSNRIIVQHEFCAGDQAPMLELWGWSASIAFTSDNKLLFVLDWGGGQIRTWNVSSRFWMANRDVKESDINAFVLSRDGKTLAVCRPGGFIIWDTGLRKHLIPPPVSGWLSNVSPDGQYLALAARKGVEVWNVRDRKLVCTFHEERDVHDRVTCVELSPDGDSVAVRSQTGLCLCSLSTGKEHVILPERFEVHHWDARGSKITTGRGDSTRGVAFSPDGKLLAAWGEYGLKFFDLSQGCKLQRSVADKSINCLEFSPDGKTYATGGRNGKVAIWNLATGKEIRSTILSDNAQTP